MGVARKASKTRLDDMICTHERPSAKGLTVREED
jgi:hypothetical protein